MKVLMIADSISNNGIGIVVNRLYHSLNDRGIKCDVVCYQDLSHYGDIVLDIEKDGNKVFSIPGVSKGIFKYIRNIRKICKKGNYDVVHIHTSLLIFLAAYAAKKENVKIRVGHAHGSKFFNYPEIVLRVLEPIGRFLNRKLCTDFVTCSQKSAHYTFGKDALFIPNYVPLKDILLVQESVISSLRKKYAQDNEIIFGYMGSLDGKKNVIFLPEIISQLLKLGVPAKLLIIGEGKMKAEIKSKVHELNCEDRIFILGQKNNCNELVQVFDYYLSSSETEGMSLSMIEAQMAGKPCIVSSLIPDDSDLKIGLFKKIEGFNSKYWAKEIAKLISCGYLSINREVACKKISENGLTENEVLNKLLKLYK